MTTSTDRPDPPPGRRIGRSRRGTAVDSTALIAGTAVNGVLAYVFFALATRTLGADGAAPVAQLWTYWSASAAVLTFPVQHWIIGAMHTAEGTASVRRSLPRVAALVIGLAGLVALVSWTARTQLFVRDDVAFPLMAAAVTVGAFLVGVVRGRLAGAERFVATGTAIASENVLRVGLALLVVAGGGGAVGFGLALAAGGLAVLGWPSAYNFPRARDGRAHASPVAFLGKIAAGSLIAQLVLTGGPVVLAIIGGRAADITALFATLALFRAPYLLTLGLVTQVTGAVTDLIVGGRHRRLRTIRHLLVVATVVGAGAAWTFGLWAGPGVIRLVFGAGISPPGLIVAVIAAATTIGLANLVFTVVLVARESSGVLTTNWLIAVGVAAVVVAIRPLPPLQTVAGAFFAAELTAFVLMWWSEWRAFSVVAMTTRADDTLAAG